MAQWSVYLPYTMTVQVQILLTSTGFHCNDSFENKEINKRGRDVSFKVVPTVEIIHIFRVLAFT